eukprot:COSAG03_NODE_23281_length_281_cov_0.857143_1_plen_54_part_10
MIQFGLTTIFSSRRCTGYNAAVQRTTVSGCVHTPHEELGVVCVVGHIGHTYPDI